VPEPGNISALFEDGAAIDAALAQAAEAARREARLLGRPLIVWQDGQVVEVPPDQLPVDSAASTPSTT
jgi:hypothetical protein